MINGYILKIQKLTSIMILICLLALIFMPLLPWTAQTIGDKTGYSGQSDIIISGETFEEARKNLEKPDPDEYRSSYEPTYEEELEVYNKNMDLFDAQIGQAGNLGGISLFFWLALFFLILVYIGIAVFKMGQKFELFGHIFFLIGVIILIFGILIVLNHVWFMGNVGAVNDYFSYLVKDMPDEYIKENKVELSISFSFFITIIMGVILLILSLIYTLTVLPVSIHALGSASRQNKMMRYQQQGYAPPGQQMPPPQQPPMQQQAPMPPPPVQQPPQPQQTQQKPMGNKFCPYCGTQMQANMKKCPSCGK